MTGGLIATVGYFILALVLWFSRSAFAVRTAAGSERVEPNPISS
jgi:hypothetical protein